MPDFPAAHSMDTTWFAIDNDGNVAVFETGESGCVPEAAYADDAHDLEDQLRALPATGFKIDPAGYQETQWSPHVEVDTVAPDAFIFMLLSDLVPVADLLARLDPQELDATTGKAVRISVRERAALTELHARGACLGCSHDWRGRDSEEIAAHGVYRYEHTCENWIAGPYARAVVPAKPLTIDQIPPAIRAKAIAYDGRFADTGRLQPAEHWACTSWEAGWLSSDGKTARPFEDHEEDWEAYAGDRGEDGDGTITFVDEPKSPAKPPKPRWWK